MRVAIAQIDPIVGDFLSNIRKIKDAYERACLEQARLLLTPELGICGYPPHDLIERPEMFDRCEAAVQELAALTRGKSCALAVGHISRNPAAHGRAAMNTVSILESGSVRFTQAKTLLPTYDVFDEARYFEPASEIRLWECDGRRVAVAICEDLWAGDPALKRPLYAREKDPCAEYLRLGAELVISISSSPYEWGKRERREKLHAEIARKLGAPLVYVNQVGANDEILFDGGAFAVDAEGRAAGRLPVFETSFGVVEVFGRTASFGSPEPGHREDQAPSEIECLSRGLVRGIQDYFVRTGFRKAILGLSGGIDSAVVATLAARALGPDNVLGVAMPSQFSSSHSLEDAEELARSLGIGFEVRPIKSLNASSIEQISEGVGELAPIALENLQSRLRGLILMTLSNHHGALVLTTGNKSELAMGYCTLYGDMCGALAPIGDLFKTRVYELARHLNSSGPGPIPGRSLTKPPSAELRPGQTDQDTLPPYEVLDLLLAAYVERGRPVEELMQQFENHPGVSEKSWVRRTLKTVELTEYKRRQAPPVLKISAKAFGIGRRIPIAKRWDQ